MQLVQDKRKILLISSIRFFFIHCIKMDRDSITRFTIWHYNYNLSTGTRYLGTAVTYQTYYYISSENEDCRLVTFLK